jgi:pyridoxine/pyridoxamine 5'-phosphate oxidase
MAHDGEYFRRRAAEARAAAICRDESEETEIAGQLALAYAALARRHGASANEPEPLPTETAEA